MCEPRRLTTLRAPRPVTGIALSLFKNRFTTAYHKKTGSRTILALVIVLERIQQMSAALCFNGFFPQVRYCYSLALVDLKLHTLRMRRHCFNALFLTQIYFGFKICPSVLEIVGLRVPALYIRDFALFNVCSWCKNCPCARCASATYVVCKDVDIFGARNVILHRFS
jgi:hypothetical protein